MDLADKLESEIIEWDAQKKLYRRDEELEQAGQTNEQILSIAADEMEEVQEIIKDIE